MAATRPVTDHDRRRVQQLHAEGGSCRQIARELGRSADTISKIARDLGLSFNRAKTTAATAARVADAKARRAQLALDLLGDAERLRAQLWQPCTVYNFGGKDNTYEEHEHPEPDAAAKLKLIQSAGVAIEKAIRLDEYDAGDTGTIGSLLGSLLNNLQAKHGDA